ncbi:MAG: TolC family protein, partial [Planctomycetia bacterium]
SPIQEAPIDCTELAYWWQGFNDPILDDLVRRSVSQNLSLREAALRICEARAKLGTVRSSLFPQIDTDGSYYYQKRSDSTGGTFGPGGIVDLTNELWSWGTNLNWEIDVFGRLKRLVEAADADIGADVELYRNTLIILLADVAQNYVNARAYQQRMAVVEENIRAQQRTLDITEKKFPAKVSELDTAQARANLMSSKSEMPGLQLGYRQAVNRLSVLLGAPIGEVDELMKVARPIPQAPKRVATGIPAELLRRRPDIRQAERRVAAQTARVGAAVGDLYPMFSLTGTFGLDAQDFNQVFQSESINAGIGPSVRWNILNFGKYTCNIEAQKFAQRQLIANYQETVLQAAEEVDNSLAGYLREQERHSYLSETVKSYRRAVEVAQKRYEQGTMDFQRVLDSQRSLLTYQNQLVQSEANVVNNVILLYRALGGGWQMPVEAAPPLGALPVAVPPGGPKLEIVPLPPAQP